MSVATITTALNGKQVIDRGSRLVMILAVVVTYTGLALAANHSFLRTFTEFILFLLAFFTPWSAINLVDYYCVSREYVDIPALSDVNGRYGKWNIPGIAVYVIGVVVQIPFLSSEFYTGPLFNLLGGVDISWIVGIVIPGAIYYWVTRAYRAGHAERTIRVDSL
jgi:NCS1 family nucleobase:cation symporter-1